MSEFKYAQLEDTLVYTGRELRPGFVTQTTGLMGDCGAIFTGPCDVATEDLVDMDDRNAGHHIYAAQMLHVLLEHADCPIRVGVLRQRMLVCILCDVLGEMGCGVIRDGDDVFFYDRKLTVSIAVPAADSCLIHLGVNIDASGAPVPAVGLSEMGVDPRRMIVKVLDRYCDELNSMAHAESKVRDIS